MKTFKRNRKSLAVIDGAWCVMLFIIIVLIFASLDWGMERLIPLAIGQILILLVFSRTFVSNYRKTAKVDENAVSFDGTKDNMYIYNAPFKDVTRLFYSKSRFYGNPALIIRLKNKKKVELDTHYFDCAELWQSVCDGVKQNSPEAEIDPNILKKIEKMKK